MFNKEYDVVVVGGGHAGCEAAAASANMGHKTLLVTMNLQNVAQMSCNPAMGGIAKGQLLREIDALGGLSGEISDKTAIQFRMLNKSKGPAMWSPRVQSDRMLFSLEWRKRLEEIPLLDFYQEMVSNVVVEHGKLKGVKTSLGLFIPSKTVILTNGTFLNGLIHIGEKNFGGGRSGERASTGITKDLEDLGFETGRMKTGTPPRVDGRSLDFAKMQEQKGDINPKCFSFINKESHLKVRQRSCYMTYTSPEVHDTLRKGFDRSPMFNGRIKSIGPRYCPSVEDKIDRFADKDRHQMFIEPEGWNTVEYYVNGFATSLPEDVQYEALRKVKGFENVKFFRPGYAIEYDFFAPTQLRHTLETKLVDGLFFAGQINGTTGYEEAASQGLVAGINAALKTRSSEQFILKRNEAYIGVLIDDLITKGTKEPYRMFTSRAEYRTILRQDNADERLTEKSYRIGFASEERMRKMENKMEKAEALNKFIHQLSVSPDDINPVLKEKNSSPVKQKGKLAKILTRPNIHKEDVSHLEHVKNYVKENEITEEEFEKVEIEIKYDGYIKREREHADKLNRLEDLKIPKNFDYNKLNSMSYEAREKLSKIKPATVSQASRVSGVDPTDISVLLVHMGR
ncbi:MAG: tRNA uridine-5-carboxymethylaminomethyl(34) synthesis enzyme MnmG [Psychroflexus sp.]|nr:tRNA uridine-5-carboxymethylaminomethyl(34) synthesis enzyme MnmG [Psychroflexus sp.]